MKKITYRPPGTAFQNPAWAPDNSLIEAVFAHDGSYDIVVMSTEGMTPDGQGFDNLTDDWASAEVDGAWSPDSQHILFVSNHAGNWDIYYMDRNGDNKTPLISGNGSRLASPSMTTACATMDFTGFLAPIGGADATGGSFGSPVRTFKMGSTIPVKFTAACRGKPILDGSHTLQVIKYADETTAGVPIDATPQDAATSGNQFRLTDGAWHFNLDSKETEMSKGIWLIVATLSDGSQHKAWIQLK